MNNLDPVSQHWTDLGGKDATGQAWSDLEIVSEHGPTDRDRQHDELDGDCRQAFDEARGRAEEREAFDRAKPHRDELTGRYTSSKLGDLISSFADWDKRLWADPHGAADALASHYLRQPPGLLQSKAEAPKSEPPAGMKERDLGNWQLDEDVKSAWRAVTTAKNENEEFKATAEHRQLLKQAFPHLPFDKALERIVQIDRDLLTNPLETAARLGAAYGMPVTHSQHKAAESEAKVGQAQQLVDHAIQSGEMPRLKEPAVDAAASAILSDPNFPRVDRGWTDLRNAYSIAVERVDAGHTPAPVDPALQAAERVVDWAKGALPNYSALENTIADVLRSPAFTRSGDLYRDLSLAYQVAEGLMAEDKREAAQRSKRASRSISGSPSPGASSQQRGGDNDSVWDAAAATVRSVRASV